MYSGYTEKTDIFIVMSRMNFFFIFRCFTRNKEKYFQVLILKIRINLVTLKVQRYLYRSGQALRVPVGSGSQI
jgi:hypothetical protein